MGATIIVPLSGPSGRNTDHESVAERALPYAQTLARRLHGSVTLVSVVDLPDEVAAYYSLASVEGTSDGGPANERQAYLDQVATTFEDVPLETVVRLGNPATEIADLVERTEHPILVLSSHARVGAARALLGSVAFSIVHAVRCPVVIIRGGLPTPEQVPALPERGTVLVPLDGSYFSETALEQPLAVLGKPDFAIHLVHVVVPATDFSGIAVDTYLAPHEEWATHYLERIAAKFAERGISVTWSVRIGSVPEQILRVADEIGADVIAMATHGRGGLGRLLFGSVTERIVHEARVPLLLVHPAVKKTARTTTSARPAPRHTDVDTLTAHVGFTHANPT